MPDRERISENELERMLKEAGRDFEYPATPDLAQAVRGRIEEEEAPAPVSWWQHLRLPHLRWAAVAAALLLVVAVPVLSPQTRSTVGDLLVGVQGAGSAAGGGASEAGGETSEVDRTGPTTHHPESRDNYSSQAAEAQGESGQFAASAGESRALSAGLDVGRELTLRKARAQTQDRHLLLPRSPGTPDEVYAAPAPHERGVVLVYHDRPGLPEIGATGIGAVLTEIPGTPQSTFLDGGFSGGDLAEVRINGKRAYWATGDRTSSLAGNTLFWKQKGRALRLETDLPEQEAIRLAESVR